MNWTDELSSCGINEQINSDNFFKFCDYFYTPNPDYAYALLVIRNNPHLKMFSPQHPLTAPGIIYVGMCVLIEECFDIMPKEGNFIIVHRDNERAFTPAFYKRKPPSVKHIFTIECQVNEPDVTALPFGHASIGGDSHALEQVRNESIDKVETPVFCRLNTNKFTKQRTKVVDECSYNHLVKVVTNQLDSENFFREIKAHRFNLSLQSGGKDTTRTWESLFLGTIPIISECVELRHFDDMPVAYYHEGGITQEWLDSIDVSDKSLRRAKMSYWRNEILNMRRFLL